MVSKTAFLSKAFLTCFLLFQMVLSVEGQNFIPLDLNQPPELQANAGPDVEIQAGDTILLGLPGPVIGGTPGFIFVWSPAAGLSDATVPLPECSPVSTTVYQLLVTDFRGCQAVDHVTVSVLNSFPYPDNEGFRIFPNPAGPVVRLFWGDGKFVETVKVFDSCGKQLLERSISDGESEMECFLGSWQKGLYVVQVTGPGFSKKLPFIHY